MMNVSHETFGCGVVTDDLLFGPLAAVAADPAVTDVAVTCDGEVWVDCGRGMERAHIDIPLRPAAVLREYAVRLCAQLGCRLDEAAPIADASAPDGTRIHAVVAPIVSQGAAISIRLPDRRASRLDHLVRHGLCPPAWEDLLRHMVAKRANMLIVGGTGAGKTTLLKALLQECSARERIVVVEEVRELGAVHHGNMVSMLTRQANVEGAGAISLAQLVKATLRMRPDRIVVGECRGEEIVDLLRASNSGHAGGMTTIHANGVAHVPARLMALGLLAGLEPRATALLASRAFDVLVMLRRNGSQRYIAEIGTLSLNGEGLAGAPLAVWNGSGEAAVCDHMHERWRAFCERWLR